jgi:hypothetical protein
LYGRNRRLLNGEKKSPFQARRRFSTNKNRNRRTHPSRIGEEGATDGRAGAAAAESETPAAGFPRAVREDAEAARIRERRWIHDEGRGDGAAALGEAAAAVLDRRSDFIIALCRGSTLLYVLVRHENLIHPPIVYRASNPIQASDEARGSRRRCGTERCASTGLLPPLRWAGWGKLNGAVGCGRHPLLSSRFLFGQRRESFPRRTMPCGEQRVGPASQRKHRICSEYSERTPLGLDRVCNNCCFFTAVPLFFFLFSCKGFFFLF